MNNKAFNIAKNRKNDEYQKGRASMVYKCSDKNTSDETVKHKNIFLIKFEEETLRKWKYNHLS